MRNCTQLFFCVLMGWLPLAVWSQSVITQWNFNSATPDNSVGTGTTAPSVGNGTLSTIGGVTATFASGTASGGSSDPASTDNSGYGLTSFPAQGTGNKTAGIQFAVSTVGKSNIVVSYDLRHSNTAAAHEVLQYTTDITAGTPVWTDAGIAAATAGDAWFNNRTFNLSTVTALSNNPHAAFRIVAAFDTAANNNTNYKASNPASNYAASGTWRFDMVTVKDMPSPGAVSFVNASTTVAENSAVVQVVAKIMNGNHLPASATIEIVPVGTATQGQDFTAPASLTFNWAANANNVNDTITFNIKNDALPESAEYFIVRFASATNAVLPAGTANVFTAFITDDDLVAPAGSGLLKLSHIASYSNGNPAGNSAEIVAYDPISQRLFIANSVGGKIDIVDFANPAAATPVASIDIRTAYGNLNSVAVKNGVVAAAIENADPQQPGKVVFFDTNGSFISQVTVGAMPDMIVFNHAGTKVLTANEGEPNGAYTIDPEGSVSVIDISGGVAGVTQLNVTHIGFTSFNLQAATLKAAGVRIFGPGATVAQDLEPEYITIDANDATAWVVCQENNALAVINLLTNTVTAIVPLGTKDHSLAGNALDVSDQTNAIQIANWPVKGLYMPDAIANYQAGGQTYLVTANEGDAREYAGYAEVVRLSSSLYRLDAAAFPNADAIKANLGRLNVTLASGDTDNDGDYDEIHTYGARSFSIWNATTGTVVWDSGNEMERIVAAHPTLSAIFNASNSNNTFKNRSDDKGPEPEGVAVATINGRVFAFIALERIGGCMVYDVTDPASPVFVDYQNTRQVAAFGGDNGAEGIIFISGAESPTGSPLVVLANEVSSTLTFYAVQTPTLHITLNHLAAENTGAQNIVRWSTAGEAQGDVFELQRSANGSHFTTVATIAANGHPSVYNHTDETPLAGTNYYRLLLKHRSGQPAYSATVQAVVNKARAMVRLYPNPATHFVQLQFNKAQQGMVQVFDVAGTLLMQNTVKGQAHTINVSQFARGLYVVRYISGATTETLTFVK